MPAINIKLNQSDLKQWPSGTGKDLATSLLNNSFFFLEPLMNKEKGQNNALNKVVENIDRMFNTVGNKSLVSIKHTDTSTKKPLDYSAALGVYFHARDSLSDEEKMSVYQFVQPLVDGVNHSLKTAGSPTVYSPQQYLDSFKGSPWDQHKQVLEKLLFLNVTEAEKAAMFKQEYQGAAEKFIEALVSLVEFARTPFKVSVAEATNAVAEGKEKSQDPKVYTPDARWNTLLNSLKATIAVISTQKSSKTLQERKPVLLETLKDIQGAWGQAIATDTNEQKVEKVKKVFFERVYGVGATEADFEKFMTQWTEYTARNGAKDATTMSLSKMIDVYTAQMQESYNKLQVYSTDQKTQLEANKKTLEQSVAQVASLEKKQLEMAKQVDESKQQAEVTQKALEQSVAKSSELESENAELKKGNESLNKKIGTHEIEIKRLNGVVGSLEKALLSNMSVLQNSRAESKQKEELLEQTKKSGEAKVAELEQQIKGLEEKNKALEQELAKPKEVAIPPEAAKENPQVQALQQQLEESKKELEQAIERANAGDTERGFLRSTNPHLSHRLQETLHQNKEQLAVLNETKAKVANLEQELKALKTANQELAAAPAMLDKELVEAVILLRGLAPRDEKLQKYCDEVYRKVSLINPNDQDRLGAIKEEVMKLTTVTYAINVHIVPIVAALSNSARWYTRGISAKASKIEQALKDIPVEQRANLLNWDKIKDSVIKSPISNFITALKEQRALIFQSKEAATFTMFKQAVEPKTKTAGPTPGEEPKVKPSSNS